MLHIISSGEFQSLITSKEYGVLVDPLLCRLQSHGPIKLQSTFVDALELTKAQKAWGGTFFGDTHTTFARYFKLLDYESAFDPETMYSKFMPILQFSGAGKSRLIDWYATVVPGICFTLRQRWQTGYPPWRY